MRRHPTNPFRMVYEDGTLFPGIGIGDCVNDWNGSGSPFDDDFGLDGGQRSTHTGVGRTTSLENISRHISRPASISSVGVSTIVRSSFGTSSVPLEIGTSRLRGSGAINW